MHSAINDVLNESHESSGSLNYVYCILFAKQGSITSILERVLFE